MRALDKLWKYAGVASIAVYVVFTFVSHLFAPSISPLADWLSDYGNPLLNPGGALFYNMGCIIVAVLLAVFYLGLARWYRQRKAARKYAVCYICAQVSGIASSVFLVLASLVTLGVNDSLHGTFGMLHMIGLDCFMAFIAIAVFMSPKVNKAIGILGYLIVAFNIVTTNAFTDLYFAEWIYFALFMAYILLITLNYKKFGQPGLAPAQIEKGFSAS